MTDLDETIVALSSAPGPGARAVVRLSGPRALDVVRPHFDPSPPEVKRGRHEGGLRLDGVASLLPADLYLWAAPHSYTGQHVAELHTLSCPPLIDLLIAQLLRSGARAARAGEFTLRGFLAGKLDLTRAEAVLGVIEANSRDELKQALGQLAGGMAGPLQELRDDLLNLLADVEAGLDFADEDLEFVSSDDTLKRLGKAMALVTLVGKQVDQRGLAERPFRVVLAGRPNAGKSSLFNALAGAARALVSPDAGTTRDYLVQRLEFEGIPVEMVDTAGWRPANGHVERQAQALAQEQAEAADLMLVCVEPGQSPDANEEATLFRPAPPALLVHTKNDLRKGPGEGLAVSAKTGEGLGELKRRIAEAARQRSRPALAPSLGRCRHHVTACLEHLRRAHSGALFGDPPEVIALELRGALDQLGEMVGAVYTDDLLDRIFSRFCIGK